MICVHMKIWQWFRPKYWPFNRKLMVIAYLWHIESNICPYLILFLIQWARKKFFLWQSEQRHTHTHTKKTKKKRTHTSIEVDEQKSLLYLWFKNWNIFKESQHYHAMGAGFISIRQKKNFAFHSDYTPLIHSDTHVLNAFNSISLSLNWEEKKKK